MGVGLNLKRLLRDKGMTIKSLSEKTGISLNTLYSITKRDSKKIDRVLVEKISEALEVQPYDIIMTETFGYELVDSTPENKAEIMSNPDTVHQLNENAYRLLAAAESLDSAKKNQEQLDSLFWELNEDGMKEAIRQLRLITEIPRFQCQYIKEGIPDGLNTGEDN